MFEGKVVGCLLRAFTSVQRMDGTAISHLVQGE